MAFYIRKEGIYQPRAGEAYALFDCNAPKARIEAYLQGRLPQKSTECEHDSPKPHQLGLELKLEEVKELVKNPATDPTLRETIETESVYSTYPSAYKHLMSSAKPVPLRNLKYALTAKNDQTNADVCEKLTTVINDIYLKFGEKKPFTSIVLGKDNGQYQPWTND